jgi:hypothetical protein
VSAARTPSPFAAPRPVAAQAAEPSLWRADAIARSSGVSEQPTNSRVLRSQRSCHGYDVANVDGFHTVNAMQEKSVESAVLRLSAAFGSANLLYRFRFDSLQCLSRLSNIGPNIGALEWGNGLGRS